MGDVLVTGATGGIGGALVAALRSAGHRVIALGRDPDRLRTLAKDGVRTIQADLTAPASLAESVGTLDALNSLVHCAGVSDVAAVADTPPETWQNTLAVNVVAAAELTRLTLPALRRSRGHVVFINASPGMRGVPRWSPFVGSKAALRELADSLREEESPHGVKVTTVYPAGTAGDRLRRVRQAFGRPYDAEACIDPDSLARLIASVLAAPPDSYIAELTVLPSPRS